MFLIVGCDEGTKKEFRCQQKSTHEANFRHMRRFYVTTCRPAVPAQLRKLYARSMRKTVKSLTEDERRDDLAQHQANEAVRSDRVTVKGPIDGIVHGPGIVEWAFSVRQSRGDIYARAVKVG